MRPSIFGSMTRRHTLSDPVRSLKPQIVRPAFRAMQGWASNATQTFLDRVAAVPPSRSRRSPTVGG